MEHNFALDLINAQKIEAINELRDCNELTIRYGLHLSEHQIKELVEKRFAALEENGRIEFGQGILKKLVAEFCDSPYIYQEIYEDTLLELQECFYYFKNESMDLISDDELISFMKRHFDGVCQGSLEYLSGTSLEELCRNTRYGYEIDDTDRYGHSF